MSDKAKVIIGIGVFLVVFLFPVWYMPVYWAGKDAEAKDAATKIVLEKPDPAKGKECVEKTDFMRASHMEMLNAWRDSVVREGNRIYVSTGGKEFNMSLQNTCMSCHKSYANFCDRCHKYLDVNLNCWDCHIKPEDKQPGRSQ